MSKEGGPWSESVSRSGAAAARPSPASEGRPGGEQPFALASPPGRMRPPGMDSPCVAVCSTLYDEICRGCGRTADEVANWVILDEEEKDAVWRRILAQGYPRR